MNSQPFDINDPLQDCPGCNTQIGNYRQRALPTGDPCSICGTLPFQIRPYGKHRDSEKNPNK